MKKALIIVDVQNDFCQGGALEVPDANSVIPYINALMENNPYDEIILTQDFHPAHHKSFASNHEKNIGEVIELNGIEQYLWPNHCIQNTFGSEFHPQLNTKKVTHIVQKGTDIEVDSYSGFQDNNQISKTNLHNYLQSKKIRLVEIVGLALDYCVKYTCLDAVYLGYITSLHFQGTKAVNIKPTSGKDTLYELLENGVTILG